MRPGTVLLTLATVTAFSWGCGTALEPREQTLALEDGDQQLGTAGMSLPKDLVVRVTYEDGEGAPGVTVHWRVTEGEGYFWESVDTGWFEFESYLRPALDTETPASGRTSANFVPTSVGTLAVQAIATVGAGAFEIGRVHFELEAQGVLIRVGDAETASEAWPEGPSGAKAPLGTVIEWVASYDTRVVATDAPDGGMLFDSGPLLEGQRFEFVPAVKGTWTYLDEASGVAVTLEIY